MAHTCFTFVALLLLLTSASSAEISNTCVASVGSTEQAVLANTTILVRSLSLNNWSLWLNPCVPVSFHDCAAAEESASFAVLFTANTQCSDPTFFTEASSNATYESASMSVTRTFTSTAPGGGDSLTVVVHCNITSGPNFTFIVAKAINAKNYTVVFNSSSVCPTAVPTMAPGPSNTDKTGPIIAIVAVAVLFTILGAVIVHFRRVAMRSKGYNPI